VINCFIVRPFVFNSSPSSSDSSDQLERLQKKTKKLEDDLFESEKEKSKVMEELEDAKSKLLQDEAIFEDKMAIISRLERFCKNLILAVGSIS
jgi:chromosome segregation ATPase